MTEINPRILMTALGLLLVGLCAAPSKAAFANGGRTVGQFQVGITIGKPREPRIQSQLFQCTSRGCLPTINGYLGHVTRRPGYVQINGLWYPPMAF